MMKKLLIGMALAVAASVSTPLLADATDHRHEQNTPRADANCPAAAAAQQGRHGMDHSGMRDKMQAMHDGHQGKDANATPGAQRGNAGEGCPMHGGRKPV
jgi:hypothetical protein